MTIAAGFRVFNGILVCADTQWTGLQKVELTKIHPLDFGDGWIVFAVSGHEGTTGMVVNDCIEAIHESDTRSIKEVKALVRKTVKDCWENYVDSRPVHERDTYSFSLIVALWHKATRKTELMFSNGPTFAPSPGLWHCVGSGEYLARYLINPLFSYALDLKNLTLLASRVLAETKDYDAYCGGYSEMLFLGQNGSVTPLPASDIERCVLHAKTHEEATAGLLYLTTNTEMSDEQFESLLTRNVDELRALRRKWIDSKRQWETLIQATNRPNNS